MTIGGREASDLAENVAVAVDAQPVCRQPSGNAQSPCPATGRRPGFRRPSGRPGAQPAFRRKRHSRRGPVSYPMILARKRRGRYLAIRLLAEQRVAVAGDQPVQPVANRARHELEHARRPPWPAECVEDGDQAVQALVGDAVDDHDVRLVDVGSQPVFAIERLAQRRLCRHEAEFLAAVEAHDRAREAGTEHANAVENDEGMAAVEVVGRLCLQGRAGFVVQGFRRCLN